MNLSLPIQVNKAISLLEQSGFEAFAVGGAVRDMVMGTVPTDYDITTNALPEETERVFSRYRLIETGIKHGTVTVIIDSMPLEITTYRIDGDYRDNRHPEKVTFSAVLNDDLSRRDFTVNTLCFNKTDGLIDLFGAVSDIQNRIIRTVGNADMRFHEDALRIMRALRFASTLGFDIEEKTSKSILENRLLLESISRERLREEFVKLIMGKYAHRIIEKYHTVIEVFIPELSRLVGCEQNTPYHKYDVFEHTLYAMDAIEKDRTLKLVMFFHDFGKPYLKTTDENGIDHFKGHAIKSREVAYEIMKRLRFDNKTIDSVSYLVGIHDMKSTVDKTAAKKRLAQIGAENYLALIEIKRADNFAKANPHLIDAKLATMRTLYDEIITNRECCMLSQLAVNGRDIISIGITDGVAIRDTLQFLLNEVIENRCENKKENLLRLAGEYNDNQKS